MNITKRFIYLMAFGLALMLISLMLHNSLTVFIVYNMLCCTLLIIDYFISDDDKTLTIERFEEDSLSIYEEGNICFTVYNKGQNEVYIELKDEIPDFHFKCENKIMKGLVSPHDKKVFQYKVVPTKRGAFLFGALHIRYLGKLKLCMKQYKIKLDKEYKVYPNLQNLRKYRLGITNNRMLKQGQKNLRMLGKGTSFESLREYVPGDEYRKINWKATARGDKPIVNQYEPEKNQHVYIFVDTGRTMGYSIRGYRKLDMVVNTALVLSDVVNQNGDQSGLLLFNTEVNSMITPGKGVGHRNKILDALYHIDSTKDTSNYEEAFYCFKRTERHRSLIFLFTDFETKEEAENIMKMLPVISRNNIVVIILIKNESVENIANNKVKNVEQMFNKGVALELIEERHKMISMLNRRGILCIECEAEKLQLATVNKYIQVKNKAYL